MFVRTKKKNTRNGFTLVELLVVVAILSLLSSNVLVSLQIVRQRARDVRRLEDINSMLTALQFYYDAEGHFPCHGYYSSLQNDFLGMLVDRGYLSSFPRDPLNNDSDSIYWYSSFRNSTDAGAPCGQIVHIDVDFEANTTICPFGRFLDIKPSHCHIFYPTPLPVPPCQYGYAEVSGGNWGGCIDALVDY